MVSANYQPDLDIEETQLSNEEIKKRSLTGAFSYLFRSIFLQIIGLISYFLLAAFLKKEDFGVYGIVIAISSFFTIISDIGLGASLIQKKESPTIRELRTVFTIQQILGWTVCLLIIGTAIIMHDSGRLEMGGVWLASAFALSFPIVSFKTISSILLERDLEFGKLAIPVIVEAIVFNVVVIFFAWRGAGVGSWAIAVILRAIIGVIVMLGIKRWSMGFAFSKEAFGNLMKVGAKFQINDMLAKLKDELFTIITAFFLSKGDLGYIQWANQTSRFPYKFSVESVMAVTFPTFSRLQHDNHALKRAIEKTLFFTTLAAFPLLAGFAVMFIPLTHLVPKYGQWQPALLTLTLFCISTAISTISTPLTNTLNAIGQINTSLKLMVMWTILQWTLTPILILKFGFNGVALSSALISLTVFIVVHVVQQKVSFQFIDQIWRQTLASVVMAFVLYYFVSVWNQSFIHLGLGVVLGGIIFLSLMIVTGFEKMKREIVSIIQKK
ncbi:MAG: oligosaccharide flippase family protein [Candidatus Woesebacteria bacterium]